MSTLRLALGLALSLASSATAATIALDPLTEPLSPNPCLPVTQPRIVFSGPWCDGASCPPGTVRQSPCGGADGMLGMFDVQPGLASVHAGATRTLGVGEGTTGVGSVASVETAAHRVDYRCDVGVIPSLDVGYEWTVPVDLRAGGSEQVIFQIEGDLSPALPLFATVYIGDVVSSGAQTILQVAAPGILALPLTGFADLPSDFDLSQVQSVSVSLRRCFDCSGVPLDARQFSLGPIRLEGGTPTSAVRTTWGRVKASYR